MRGSRVERPRDGPSELRSTKSIFSSLSWFSVASLVSQELGVLLGTLVGKRAPQLVPPRPGFAELHETYLPAAESHIPH